MLLILLVDVMSWDSTCSGRKGKTYRGRMPAGRERKKKQKEKFKKITICAFGRVSTGSVLPPRSQC